MTLSSGGMIEVAGSERHGRIARWLSQRSPLGARTRDPLTGLAVREELLRRGPALLARAAGEGRPVALLVLDLDGLKGLNDSAGHHAGDRVLATVGSRLAAVCGPEALAVRLSGDEFAVLTWSLASREHGAALAQDIIDSIAAPLELDELTIAVSVSVGLATYDEDGDTIAVLLRAADQAMYAAKSAGTGLWRASTPAGRHEPGRTRRLLADLDSGRAASQLVMHYQPQVDARTGDAVGFEALARWDHPELGLLRARQFVPLAERSGNMGPLSSAVLELALDDLPRLRAAVPDARMSINVTRRHILGRGLVDDLCSRVARHGLSPSHIVLEITEPVTRTSTETAEVFGELSRRGFDVSIRGFGTARSSLTALWSNPAVREVKVDPSIVDALEHDEEVPRLVRALTGAAHGLGIRVVAEGVEDAATAALMRHLGCDVLQGYWLGQPTSLDGVEDWCRTWSLESDERLG